MAVNARTFQVLYVIRQRALADLDTTRTDIGEFIAGRRESAPESYDKAYIAPSALQLILQRMTTTDGLLMLEGKLAYGFTPKGSQMADLMQHLDGCSTWFIDNYKEAVSHAVLKQRSRLGQGRITPREVASIANISLDSARRGLAACFNEGNASEDRGERTPTYALIDVAKADPESPEEIDKTYLAGDDEPPEPGSIASALADIDESDDWPIEGDQIPEADPDSLVLKLGTILQDDGPDDEVEELRSRLTNLGVDVGEETVGPQDEDPGPFKFNLDPDGMMVDQEADPYDWNSVPPSITNGFVLRAMAAGVTLAQFLDILNLTHERKIREALFEGDERGLLVDPSVARMLEPDES
jgi:hypothetical protein